jgi:hypothetical protein
VEFLLYSPIAKLPLLLVPHLNYVVKYIWDQINKLWGEWQLRHGLRFSLRPREHCEKHIKRSPRKISMVVSYGPKRHDRSQPRQRSTLMKTFGYVFIFDLQSYIYCDLKN